MDFLPFLQFNREIGIKEHNAKTEVILADRTRCDCVTATHAVEVEYAHKWKEAIGQALWYAMQTNKKPGIVLIIRSKKDLGYSIKLNSVITQNKLPIKVWEIGNTKTLSGK